MKKPTLSILAFLSVICAIWGQPSEEQYQGILELVKSGETEAARIKVETYLEIFPDDAQLKSMSVQLAEATSKKQVATVEAPEPAPKSTLSGEDRLEVETVIAAAQNLAELSSGATRKAKAVEILNRPIPKSSSASREWLPYWLARAALALEADDLYAGWQAGQALKELNAIESSEPLTRKVMTQLNMKGWLVDDLKSIEAKAEMAKWEPWLGTWQGSGEVKYRDLPIGKSNFNGFHTISNKLVLRLEGGVVSAELELIESVGFAMTDYYSGAVGAGKYKGDTKSNIPGEKREEAEWFQSRKPSQMFVETGKNEVLELALSNDGEACMISYREDFSGEVKTKRIKLILSEDRSRIYIGSSDSRLEDFTKYGNDVCYTGQNRDGRPEPILVALRKQR